MSRPLALTLGEPAGIGPDITLAAWQRRAELGPAAVLSFSPIRNASRNAPAGSASTSRSTCSRPRTRRRPSRRAAGGGARPSVTAKPGKPDATSAPAAIASIDRAVADVIAGRAAAVVTNPVAKSVLYNAGFADPGHTEYLAKLVVRAHRRAWHRR